jgi:uncharacterized protein (TIGR02466 family)
MDPASTMPVKAWFPTYVYEAPLQEKGSDAFALSLLEDCRNVREQDSAGKTWCGENYPFGYTSYGTQRNLHQTLPRFQRLERKVWRHVKRFAARLDMDLREATLVMTDCWVNIMSRSAVHPFHAHPGAAFSGTFYVSTPEGCSGIRFEDPRIEKRMVQPPRRPDCRPANRLEVSHDATAGKLVLFESWLRHEVSANPTTDERVSVSFNFTWV